MALAADSFRYVVILQSICLVSHIMINHLAVCFAPGDMSLHREITVILIVSMRKLTKMKLFSRVKTAATQWIWDLNL